jgi:uncharacterized membrane protein
MDIQFKLIVLVFGIVCTGLTAGLCFTWNNAVTPGIGMLDDLTFLKSFQAMNRAIINPTFLVVFFSPAIVLFVSAYLFKDNSVSFWLILLGAILFFGGMALVTIFGNVPLNEVLDKVDLDSLSTVDLQALREKFEQPWNQWHLVRTLSSIGSFILLLIGLMYSK